MKKTILAITALLMMISNIALATPGDFTPEELAEMNRPHVEHDIFGLWKLTEFYIVEEGRPNKDWCEGMQGSITYKRNGMMYVVIDCEETYSGSGAEALGGFLFYSGFFKVDTENGTVTHMVETFNHPSLHKNHVRSVEMNDRNSLRLTGPLGNGSVVVKWVRFERQRY